MVLRVPVLYGDAEKPAESAVNVLMDSVWKAQEEGAGVKMDHWALRYPTNTEDVGRVCQGTVPPLPYLSFYKRPSIHLSIVFSTDDSGLQI